MKNFIIGTLVTCAMAGVAGAQGLVAADDIFTVAEGTTLQIEDPGVLENDTWNDDELPLTAAAEIVDWATSGYTECPSVPALDICEDGSFDYVPDPGFVGSDSFTYRVVDGAEISNTATVTITVTGCEAVSLAGPPAVEGFRCWIEDSYLAKLTELGHGNFSEGFEDDGAWGTVRYPMTSSAVSSQNVVWGPNNTVSGITTDNGRPRTGTWGLYELPHGDSTGGMTDPLRDGFKGSWTGAGSLRAVGGWLSSNTGGAKARFVLDGVEIGFPNPDLSGPFKFFGVIDTTGFAEFEIFETEGVVEDQEYIFADDFTFGAGAATTIFSDDFESGDTSLWSSSDPAFP